MKNRKWQRVLSWLLTLTMLLGTFESNILAVNAMDDEAVEADAEIDEEEVVEADEDVEEPEVVGINPGVTFAAVAVDGGQGTVADPYTIGMTYGIAPASNPTFTATVSGDATKAVTWKMFKTDWTEITEFSGLTGTANGRDYVISGTPNTTGEATVILSAISNDYSTVSGNAYVKVNVAKLQSNKLNVADGDVDFGTKKMGYTVDAASTASNNVVPQTITIVNTTGADINDLNVTLGKGESFSLENGGNNIALANNGKLEVSVKPKTGLIVNDKTAADDYTTFADTLTISSNVISSNIVKNVSFKLGYDLAIAATKDGAAFAADEITVSAGNAMPVVAFTVTGGNGEREWEAAGIEDKLPAGITASRSGDVVTISGTPVISDKIVGDYALTMVAKDNKNQTSGNNKITKNFTIKVVSADVAYTANGEAKDSVIKFGSKNDLQAEDALEIVATNKGESEITVNASLDSDKFYFTNKDSKESAKIAAGSTATFVVYPKLNSISDDTVKITLSGNALQTKDITYRLVLEENVLMITEPANGELPTANIGEDYSYTFKADGTVSKNVLEWTISTNEADPTATLSANELKAQYGLTLSANGVLSGTPTAISENGVKFIVTVSGNGIVSSKEVTLKIVSTDKAIVVSANGVVLNGKTASENVVDLGTINTKATSVSNNTAKIVVKNTSSVNVGNVTVSIESIEKKNATGKYVKLINGGAGLINFYQNDVNLNDTVVFSGDSNAYEEFSIAPSITITGEDPKYAGDYRVLVTVNSNANLVAKAFYATLTLQNTVVIDSPAEFTTFEYEVNKQIKPVSFNAISKNDVNKTKLTNVEWSWTASGNSTLPEGLTLSANGTLTGTPTKVGEYNVSVNVLDKTTNDTDTKSYTIIVNGSSEIKLTNGDKTVSENIFPGVVKGEAITASEFEVAVKHVSGPALSDLKISLEDAPGFEGSAKHFKLSTDTIAKLNVGGFDKFTVVPVDSSESGFFCANVVVSNNAITPQKIQVGFVVVDKLTINDVDASKLAAEVGKDYSLTVSAASVSINKLGSLNDEIKWTYKVVSENGAKKANSIDGLTDGSAVSINAIYNVNGVPTKSGSYIVSVSANLPEVKNPTNNVVVIPAQSASAQFTVEVSKSASVNVIGASGSAASGYSTGKSTPEAPSASNNVTAYTFASRAVGYDANIETATFTVKNGSKVELTVSGNASSTDFVVTDGAAAGIAADGTKSIKVAPKKGLAAGTYTADLVISGAEIVEQKVALSFTVEEVKDGITLSGNNAVIGSEGLDLTPVKRTASATDTTVNIKNTGNVDIKIVSINEVLDANGTDIDINDTAKFKLAINKATAINAALKPDAETTFAVKPAKTDVAGEYTAYVKVSYAVGTAIKTPVVIKVNYTIYKDSVSVNVTPSANTVSINGTASVSENYSTAYSVGFSVANGEAGVAGDTTETLYDLRVALTGADADKFVLTADKVNDVFGADKVVKGASYSFNIAAKSGLSYGVYKATLEVSASNMTTITKEIVFTVTGKAGSYTKSISSNGVSDNVVVNVNRIKNTLQALVDNSVAGVTANGAVYTVQKDITVDFTVADSVEIKLDPKHSISTDSVSVNRNGKTATTTVGDGSYYDTIYFNIYNIVTFKANGGKFADGSDIVSVNVVNGSKVAELPSVSKNNASLKGWMDEKLNEFTTATTVSQDIVLTASWSAHTYPASASGNKAGQIEWTWNGTASDNFAGTFVTIYCTDTDCPDKAASAIKLDATITVSGKDASCTKGEAKVYTATAAKDGNVYTDTTTVAGEEGLGHKWVVDASNPVWAEDYSSVSINKTCEAAYHTSEDGDKTVAIVTKNISFNGAEATCTTSGNGVYTATFTSEDDPAISENIVVSVNAAEVPALGHDYKVKAEWTDNGFENTPSVNAVLVCSRCEEVVSENLTVSVELVSENEAKKDYKAVVTYEDKTYESEIYSVMNHTEHSWSVSFNWTGTTSENAVVEAIATCANGGETVVLSPDVEKKVTSKNVTYTATVKDPDGKEWSEKYTVNLESGEGKVGGGEGIEIRDLEDSYPLTGKQIKPAITVWDLTRDVQLAYKVDYTVKYGKNNAAGEKAGSITIVGKGNYTGQTVTANFDIVDPMEGMSEDEVAELAALKKAKIAKIDAATFTGSAIYPETISIKTKNDGEVVMKSNGDGTYEAAEGSKSVVVVVTNNINKGTATVAVTGSDATTLKKTFKIKAADINAAVIADIDATTFAVKGATPALDVTFKASDDAEEIALVQGMDYTVSYKNNKAVGTATVTLKGKGNFAKKGLSKTFEVTAFDLSEVEEDAIAVNAFTGIKAGKVKVTVVDGNGSVIPAKNYTVEVFQGESETALAKGAKLAAGDATIKITAKGSNLTESVEKSIVVADKISKAKVKVNLTKTYTGEAITLTDEDFNNIAVTLNKAPLVYGEDFVVASYANNIKKGKMTVTIEGIGKYSGTKTFKVKIAAQEMKPAE